MVCEIICVGTEILLGNIVNTNAAYLAEKFAELGINNYYQVVVGDNEERLFNAISTALTRADLVILSGGLGPTKDDLTKEVTAKVLNRELVLDIDTKEYIKELLSQVGLKEITDNNWKQALIIEGATIVKNDNGTAPGLIVTTEEGKTIILLPGPPNELIPMFLKDIIPYLKGTTPNILYSNMVKICGIGESKAETMIGNLIDNQTNPTIAPYAKTGEVHLRITANATSVEEGVALITPVVDELKVRFGNHIYTTKEEENLQRVVVKLLLNHKLTLATAESCTGGLVASSLVEIEGVSCVLKEGFITYSNEAKEKYLSVNKKTLNNFGAVSHETAKEMAFGAMKAANSNASIAITGIAGPDGGTDKKPVGLVYIAIGLNNKVIVYERHFFGNRQKVRESATITALNLLRLAIIDAYTEKDI
jgi:nicotinamide-nucleotide amidase